VSLPFPEPTEELARIAQRRERADDVAAFGPRLDPGIRRYVEVLYLNGVETYESCQGGPDPDRPDRGHAYPEPSVRFHGSQGAGWWALQVCLDHGFPVQSLSRIWTVEDREPHGPTWQLVFRAEARPPEGLDTEPPRRHWARELLGVEPVDNGDGTETVTWPPARPPEGLDAAWAAAEAALPEGWRIESVTAWKRGEWQATAVPTPASRRTGAGSMWLGKTEFGATPAAALLALAARLSAGGATKP
jgi:hypothetical protein